MEVTQMRIRNGIKRRRGRIDVYTGVFVRKGLRRDASGLMIETILLEMIRSRKGYVVCAHMWFDYTKGFRSLGPLETGDLISFHAKAGAYEKAYTRVGEDSSITTGIRDYRLNNPTRIQRCQFRNSVPKTR